MKLRDYQQSAVNRVRDLESSGESRILLVAPTGSGKTVLAAELIRERAAQGARCLFLAHRRELIRQTSDKLTAIGLRHGVQLGGVGPGNKRLPYDPDAPVQVASIQTYVRRAGEKNYDVIVGDEAHHIRAASYETVLADNPCALTLGLTATPWRTDGKGLGEIFSEVVVVAKFRELMDRGFLTPYKPFAYNAPELTGLEVGPNGDLTEAAASKVMSSSMIVGDIVNQWAEHSSDRRTVLFAASVERSMELVREVANLRRHGAPLCQAEHIDANTPADVRDALLDPENGRLANGETMFVSNVGLLTEGTDIPSIEAIVLARPTFSTALALQCMGRGFRPSPVTGKIDVLIHDHAGVMFWHGRPDDDRDFSLLHDAPRVDPKKPREIVKACKQCQAICDLGDAECWSCGTAFKRGRGRPKSVAAQARVNLLEPEAARLIKKS